MNRPPKRNKERKKTRNLSKRQKSVIKWTKAIKNLNDNEHIDDENDDDDGVNETKNECSAQFTRAGTS